MSRTEKLLSKMLSCPKDFTWDELVRILHYYRYVEMRPGKTGGSRRKFLGVYNDVIILHKPHPSNIIKGYILIQVIEHLTAKGHIQHE